MEPIRRPLQAVALIAIGWLVVGVSAQAGALTPLVIETGGSVHTFEVEVAATEQERQIGLMFRRRLPANAGMLFDYITPQPVAMWMKNTYIPLDMLFIAANGRVVNIAKRTVPHSLRPIASKGRVRAVLEVNSGTIDRLGILPGALVRHRVFRNLSE